MNPEEAKDYAKGQLQAYLNAKGINTSTNFSCLNPSHDDKHPSMSFDSRRNRCHCFSCGVDYDIFDVVGLETGLTGKELFEHVYRLYNISVDYSDFNKNQNTSKSIPHPESKTKIDINKMNSPSFLMVLTGIGDYAYQRSDGVLVVPIGCLKN